MRDPDLRALLLELAMGKANALSAFLTGEMQVEGDVSLAGKLEKFRPFRWDPEEPRPA